MTYQCMCQCLLEFGKWLILWYLESPGVRDRVQRQTDRQTCKHTYNFRWIHTHTHTRTCAHTHTHTPWFDVFKVQEVRPLVSLKVVLKVHVHRQEEVGLVPLFPTNSLHSPRVGTIWGMKNISCLSTSTIM